MAMLRHRAAKSSTGDARLLIFTGSPAEVLYSSELMRLAAGDGLAVHHTFTRDPPAAWRVSPVGHPTGEDPGRGIGPMGG